MGRKGKKKKQRNRTARFLFLLAAAAATVLWGCSDSSGLSGKFRQLWEEASSVITADESPENGGQQSETSGESPESAGQQSETAGVSPENGGQQSETAGESSGYQQEETNQEELAMRYYYSLLDEDSRRIYRELVQGIKDGQEVITTHGSDPELVNEICIRVFMDYPEFFWCSGSVETTGYPGIFARCEVRPEYTCTAEERALRQQQIEAAAGQCLAGLPSEGSTYEKIRYLYTWLVEQTEYASDSTDNQNIYSVFVNHRSVCAGYARAFQYLTNRAGIFSLYVTGTVNQGQSHAWNIVSCDGTWYNVDVTFGDPVFIRSEETESGTGGGQNRTFYDYLCVSDREFRRNHTPDPDLTLPSCESDALEYYRMIGRYFEQASESQMLSLMQQDIQRMDSWSDFKYSSEAAYRQAVSLLPQVMNEAASYLCRFYNLPQTTFQYSQDPETFRISVYWNYS